MICFAFFMAYAWEHVKNRKVLGGLYAAQWALCVLWNLVFFKYQLVLPGLILLLLLTIVISYFLLGYRPQLQKRTLWVLPYFLWLLVACSLNGYILIQN